MKKLIPIILTLFLIGMAGYANAIDMTTDTRGSGASDKDEYRISGTVPVWVDSPDTILTTQGDILIRGSDATLLKRLGAGATAGQLLASAGAGDDPLWGGTGGASDTQVYRISGTTAAWNYVDYPHGLLLTVDADLASITANTLYKDNVVKAWCNFDGTGTPAHNVRFNVDAAITDNGTGDHTITWTTNFSGSDNAVIISSNAYCERCVPTNSAAQCLTYNHDGNALDSGDIWIIAIGRQ